jgi:DNA-binding response OmpR family regulator
LTGAFGLKGFEVSKAYSIEECLDKVNELDGKVDIVFVDGKIAVNRGAMLIIKVKRINSNIKIMVLTEDETDDETRVLEYGADEFATKPISAESVVDKVYSMLATTVQN